MVDEYDAFTNEYMDPHGSIPAAWTRSDAASLLNDFWATVKCLVGLRHGDEKMLYYWNIAASLVDNTSGFNIEVNISFGKEVTGLCGLTREDRAVGSRLGYGLEG